MKRFKIFFSLLLITSIWSCDNRLEEIAPEDALSSGVIFGDFGTIEAATVGVYNSLQGNNLVGGSGDYINDFMADNVDFVGSFTTLQDVRDFSVNATNGTTGGLWFDIFQITRVTNNIITVLPDVDPASVNFDNPTDASNFNTIRQNFIAEARFARALAYFYGVNLFAQPYQISNGSTLGLPIVDQFFEGDIVPFQLPRSTVNETHAFIESDLLFAMNNLPVVNDRDPVRASSTAARGLLSRLYLYREQWSEAANMANDVINTSGFSLASDFGFYNSNSSEHVFQIINQPDDVGNGSFDTFYNPTALGGRGDLKFSEDLIAAFDPADLRFAISSEGIDAGNNAARFTSKYPNGFTNESDPNILRMGEMYLNRAEANFRGGTTIGASPLDDINTIRARAGLSALATITLDDILDERRRELAFEGHRRMDLLRNGQNLLPNGSAISDAGANFTILPLPQQELTRNPNIQQNPGY